VLNETRLLSDRCNERLKLRLEECSAKPSNPVVPLHSSVHVRLLQWMSDSHHPEALDQSSLALSQAVGENDWRPRRLLLLGAHPNHRHLKKKLRLLQRLLRLDLATSHRTCEKVVRLLPKTRFQTDQLLPLVVLAVAVSDL